jgi:hypothetical protein
MKKLIPILFAAFLCACSPETEKPKSYQMVTLDEAQKLNFEVDAISVSVEEFNNADAWGPNLRELEALAIFNYGTTVYPPDHLDLPPVSNRAAVPDYRNLRFFTNLRELSISVPCDAIPNEIRDLQGIEFLSVNLHRVMDLDSAKASLEALPNLREFSLGGGLPDDKLIKDVEGIAKELGFRFVY